MSVLVCWHVHFENANFIIGVQVQVSYFNFNQQLQRAVTEFFFGHSKQWLI